jgi:hypothetical protein
MSEYIAGIFSGAAGLLLIAYLMTRPEPKAEPHTFSAVSTGDDGANQFQRIFKALEHAEQTRH